AVSYGSFLPQRNARAVIGLAIRNVADGIGVNAPFFVMLDHEPARRGKDVHNLKMLLHPQFAHKKEFLRKIKEELGTAKALCLSGQRPIRFPYHLTVREADRHEFVKGEYDARPRQCVPRNRE